MGILKAKIKFILIAFQEMDFSGFIHFEIQY